MYRSPLPFAVYRLRSQTCRAEKIWLDWLAQRERPGPRLSLADVPPRKICKDHVRHTCFSKKTTKSCKTRRVRSLKGLKRNGGCVIRRNRGEVIGWHGRCFHH